MKKNSRLFRIIVIGALVGAALAGCKITDDEKPSKLSEDASYGDAYDKLEEIIDYCGLTPTLLSTRTKAEGLKTGMDGAGESKWESSGKEFIDGINDLIDDLD
jgi:hypothetical protein